MMAEAYQTAKTEIEQAFALLEQAKKRLGLSFKQESYRFMFSVSMHSRDYDKPEALIKEVNRDCWAVLVERMGLKQIASIKRAAEIDKQIESGDGMPEISEANLIAMLKSAHLQVPEMFQQAITEVFDWLRPHSDSWKGWHTKYKTNEKSRFELGRRIIKGWMVEWGYGPHWHVAYRAQQNLTALDNVFSMLDGKGVIKSHIGPLADAINACPKVIGTGQTDYFVFKCCKNGNLHIEFRRMDLVAKINQIAGGMALKDVMPV